MCAGGELCGELFFRSQSPPKTSGSPVVEKMKNRAKRLK